MSDWREGGHEPRAHIPAASHVALHGSESWLSAAPEAKNARAAGIVLRVLGAGKGRWAWAYEPEVGRVLGLVLVQHVATTVQRELIHPAVGQHRVEDDDLREARPRHSVKREDMPAGALSAAAGAHRRVSGRPRGRRRLASRCVSRFPAACLHHASAPYLAFLWVDGEALGAVKVVHRLRAPVWHLGCGGAREVGLPAALSQVISLADQRVEIEEDGGQPILGAVLDRL